MHSKPETGQQISPTDSRGTDKKLAFGSQNECDLTKMSQLLGKKWHPVIIGQLLEEGPQGFSALQDSIGEISSKVLSENLENLEDAGVVERTIVSERPFRVEYSLTASGKELETVITEMRSWSCQYT